MTRLGRSLISDTELLSPERIIAELESVEPDAVSELASMLLAPERLSVAGIGPNEELFYAAADAVNPGLARRSAA
jgi:predicted Zn-dependent peptidase